MREKGFSGFQALSLLRIQPLIFLPLLSVFCNVGKNRKRFIIFRVQLYPD